jgi:hypothetical protein
VVDKARGLYYNNLANEKREKLWRKKYDVYFYEKARASQP